MLYQPQTIMKKGLLTTVLLALGLLTAQGQTIVRGHIVNERGEGIEYVSIGFDEDSVGVISDANGRFEVTIPKGRKKDLQFSHVSYDTKDVPYQEYGKGTELTVVLNDKVIELAEVVVGKKNKPKSIVGKGMPAPGVVGYGGPREKASPDSPEGGITFSCSKDYVISDILLSVAKCDFKQCTVSFNLYEKRDGKYVNILQKPIYEIIKQENGKHTLDVRPEETLLLKRKKDYYLSVRVVDSDSPGYLYMKAYLKNGLYRRVVKGKQRKFPICPALRIKGYEAEAAR